MEHEEGIEKFKCDSAGCDNQAAMTCQICIKLKLKPIRYCGQDCFKKNWAAHKVIHANAPTDSAVLKEDVIAPIDPRNVIDKEVTALNAAVFEMQGRLIQAQDALKIKGRVCPYQPIILATIYVYSQLLYIADELAQAQRDAFSHSSETREAGEKIAIYVQYTAAQNEYTRAMQSLNDKKSQILAAKNTDIAQIRKSTSTALKDYEEAVAMEEEHKKIIKAYHEKSGNLSGMNELLAQLVSVTIV
jgi:hypothetical protein